MKNLSEFLLTNNITRVDLLNKDDRAYFKNYMIDTGYTSLGEDFYEDPGGHVIHESDLDSYVDDFIKAISEDEFIEVMNESRNEQGS